MSARPKHMLSNDWSVKHPFLDYSLWMGTTFRGCQYIGWFKSNLQSPSDVLRTRQWAIEAGLYKFPTTGVPKDMETARREAAAMLAQASLARAQSFTALVAPNKSDSPSGHTLAAPLDAASLAKVQKKLKAPKFSAPPPWSPPRTERRAAPPTLPQHPCFTNPKPVSDVQPQISVKRNGFRVRDLPPSYPYEIHENNKSYRIPFFEFSGLGAPTSDLDVGTEGDVYLDLTPGRYALYGKAASGWKRWMDTGETIGVSWPNSDWLVKHPHFEDYALWISLGEADRPRSQRHIGWFKVGTVKAQRRVINKLGLVGMQKLKVKKGVPMKSEYTMQYEAHKILEYVLGDKYLDSIPPKGSAKRQGSPLMLDVAKKRKEDSSTPLDLGPFSMRFEYVGPPAVGSCQKIFTSPPAPRLGAGLELEARDLLADNPAAGADSIRSLADWSEGSAKASEKEEKPQHGQLGTGKPKKPVFNHFLVVDLCLGAKMHARPTTWLGNFELCRTFMAAKSITILLGSQLNLLPSRYASCAHSKCNVLNLRQSSAEKNTTQTHMTSSISDGEAAERTQKVDAMGQPRGCAGTSPSGNYEGAPGLPVIEVFLNLHRDPAWVFASGNGAERGIAFPIWSLPFNACQTHKKYISKFGSVDTQNYIANYCPQAEQIKGRTGLWVGSGPVGSDPTRPSHASDVLKQAA
ncbi:hypothetical protein C8R45DRAFT_936156 [Mycena sanguinolenta]|nr:hypothetical protein C8R45DRAFT_936156 [Mycena sanguinolenta]